MRQLKFIFPLLIWFSSQKIWVVKSMDNKDMTEIERRYLNFNDVSNK